MAVKETSTKDTEKQDKQTITRTFEPLPMPPDMNNETMDKI